MKSDKADTVEFSRLRRIFFPIYMYELKKVLPMAFIFFLILTIYTLTRNVKDSLVVTAPNSGAEVLSFLKLFCVTPAAFIFLILYAKASNLLNAEKLFYATLTPFVIFFGLFGFVIYPHLDFFQPIPETVAAWQEAFPRYKWIIAVCGNWTYSLFYVLSEIWGSAIISLSFWQFANQITKISEAKRHYAFFGFMAQTALIASGAMGKHFSQVTVANSGGDAWGESLRWLMGMVFIFGLLIMAAYRWMYTHVLTDPRFYDRAELPSSTGKKKANVSLSQSFKEILTSPYLGLIALLVICYGTSVNFVEAVWKSQVKVLHPNPNDFNAFMGQYTIVLGIVSMVMMLVGSNILRLFNWFTAAVITPVLLLALGGIFFVFVVFRSGLAPMIENIGTTPVILAVILGAIVAGATKATKYALFDLTKEMAYIPLDEEMKVKGKATVDVLGGRLGKASGAGFQAILFVLIPGATFLQISPIVAVAFVVICSVWIMAVKGLSKRITAIAKDKPAEAAA
ncbi:MAG: NTP/NDP exchange transporter [Puniceicoccales bacterium]|nr:NTP/NDP exchange transporter [Puniceicoccales bacterium]